MQERIKEIQEKAVELINRATSPEALNEARVKFLGKKGELTAILKGMKDVDPELRPKVGAWVNEARQQLEKKIDSAGKSMEAEILKQRLAAEKIDVTLPGKAPAHGHLHPNEIALREVERMMSTILKNSIYRRDIRRATSRILFISTIISCCALRHHRCRHMSWRRDSSRSASYHPAGFSGRMLSTRRIRRPSIRSRDCLSTRKVLSLI